MSAIRTSTSVLVAATIIQIAVAGASAQAADNVPPIGGDYAGGANVVAIPIADPEVKAISGALFKPAGKGPFPAVIYMSGCTGIGYPPEAAMEKIVIDHLASKGVATLIVDPFTPRHQDQGICDNVSGGFQDRGANDVRAARALLASMPDIDQRQIFLQGYDYGAVVSLMATDAGNEPSRDIGVAGVVAFYPYCAAVGTQRAVPTLVLFGDKDDWSRSCRAFAGATNWEIVVYPGATNGFTKPFDKPFDWAGQHFEYDAKATKDAQDRVDAFMAVHMK